MKCSALTMFFRWHIYFIFFTKSLFCISNYASVQLPRFANNSLSNGGSCDYSLVIYSEIKEICWWSQKSTCRWCSVMNCWTSKLLLLELLFKERKIFSQHTFIVNSEMQESFCIEFAFFFTFIICSLYGLFSLCIFLCISLSPFLFFSYLFLHFLFFYDFCVSLHIFPFWSCLLSCSDEGRAPTVQFCKQYQEWKLCICFGRKKNSLNVTS